MNKYDKISMFNDVHCKCLQGFTGSLWGNWSAGISELHGFIRIGGDFPVNSKVITCNAYLSFFHAISACVPKVRIMGISDYV